MAKDLTQQALTGPPNWNAADLRATLDALYDQFVFNPLTDSISWYFAKRHGKRRLGMAVRVLAVAAGGFAVILPLLAELLPQDGPVTISPAWAAVALLLGAGLVWIDRFLGGTSGWLRYVRTGLLATELRDEAVLEWTQRRSQWAQPQPTAAQAADALKLIAEFNQRAHAVVRDETAVWMQEFQDSLKQLDGMLQSRLERSEKVADELKQRREQKGGLNVLVANADLVRDCVVTLHRDNDDRPDAPSRPLGPDGRATFPNLDPGLWRVVANARIAHNGDALPASAETGTNIAPGAFTQAELTLRPGPTPQDHPN